VCSSDLRGRARIALREMQRILEDTRHGFSAEEFDRGRESFASQITLYSEWNAEIARRYAELALFDQPLVTPKQELDMLARLRASEFNDFVKANVHWDAGSVCAIGEGPALESIL
jgi:predicted Zn-dependent peptidase